jgi:hypothetical protein
VAVFAGTHKERTTMKTNFTLAATLLTLVAVHAPADAASIGGGGRMAAGSKELVKSAQIKKATLIERQIGRPNLRNLDGLKRKIRR